MANTGKGQLVTRAGLAEIFGVSLPTVDLWRNAGCPYVKRGGRGIEWQFATADVAGWLRDRAIKDATGDTKTDEAEIDRRTKMAKMRAAELELAKALKEVAPIQDFERAQAAAFAEIRSNVINVTQRVVVQLLGETDETTFKAKLNAELKLALQAAADADLVVAEDPEDGQDDDD
jgi:phage terminase Nu1 subunit (DNA packaging protein)